MKAVILICWLAVSLIAMGQDTGNYINQVNNFNTLSNGVGQFDYVYKSAPQRPGMEGSPYWYELGAKGAIFLKGKSFIVSTMKYDVMSNQLEVLEDGQISVMKANRVDSFNLFDGAASLQRTFVKPTVFSDKIAWDGFIEIIEKGEVTLFRRCEVTIKEPTYDRALMVGNKNREIILKKSFYLCKDGVCSPARKRKEIRAFFKEVEFDLPDHSIDANNEEQLKRLVRTYNSHFR